jgi:hypothetical protein
MPRRMRGWLKSGGERERCRSHCAVEAPIPAPIER